MSSDQERLTGLDLEQRWHVLNFDLRLGSKYHTARLNFFDRCHTVVATLSAFLGSTTAVALLADIPGGKNIAVACSLIVALGAAIDSVIGFTRKARQYGELMRDFILLEIKLIETPCSEVSYISLLKEKRLIEIKEPPGIPALADRCHIELARLDGLKDGDDGMPAPQSWLKRHFAQVWFFA